MRSIAQHYYAEGIRTNAICPGIVRTNLVDQTAWSSFPDHRFIGVDLIAAVVLQLVDGGSPAGQGITDHHGRRLAAAQLYGQAVEISDTGLYFRDQHEFCDDGMREVMAATVLENQVGAILSDK